jgi:hypothetical protein
VGAAQRCAAACGLDSALGERGASDAPPWKAAYYQEPDLYGFSSDGAREKAAQRWAAVRRSDLEAKRFMLATSERNSG